MDFGFVFASILDFKGDRVMERIVDHPKNPTYFCNTPLDPDRHNVPKNPKFVYSVHSRNSFYASPDLKNYAFMDWLPGF